ncbi:hypothetical protein GCM10009087_00340 [Sphingomonas oligophenolica]|uniref:Uncharacterized protein n=1 Tax=Sphingomonas oligophenolica TaxID=301154 RepID=A0ABU9YAE3_9SPHN
MAEALAVWRTHGERSAIHVAERIGALAINGDIAGVERWQQIAARLEPLLAARQTHQ